MFVSVNIPVCNGKNLLEYEMVSIITPSFNTAEFIDETIQSVLAQTYRNWEMIIVDDCSTDNTDEKVVAYHDERIRFIKNEKNSGAALSRNKALRMARGRWIAFLDSDDLWTSDKLEKQISFMKENNYAFSYTKYIEIDEKSCINGHSVSGPRKINRRKMYGYCWPGCLTVMYDVEKIGLVQIADLKKNNDYAMWLQAIKYSDCFLLEEHLAMYRKRSGSISNTSFAKLIKWHYKLYRIGEKRTVFMSLIYTFRNLIWGVYKKIKYVKNI